jgi:hypothetical protein
MAFFDSVKSYLNLLANRRNAVDANYFGGRAVGSQELREIFRSGIGSKIIRLKTDLALNDTLQFESEADEEAYQERIEAAVKQACKFMLGFGRGLVVLVDRSQALHLPRPAKLNPEKVEIRVFSGDMVTVSQAGVDLLAPRYNRPVFYHIRGQIIHYTWCVDFTYYQPAEEDASRYAYGGVSESELIHPQLINDGIVERAGGSILEKNSTLVYKMKGFADLLASGKEAQAVAAFTAMEDSRSIYGAVVVDAEDSVESVAQALTNLADVSRLSLQRLAMVTGIPAPILVGEESKGLNSSGDNEAAAFRDTIENLQYGYLLDPVNELCALLGLGPVEFKDNQQGTPLERAEYEAKVIANAEGLQRIGLDAEAYLVECGVVPEGSETEDDAPTPEAPEATETEATE